MPSIPREVAEHSLEIRAGSKPVKPRLRRFDEEKRKIIGEEIHKLLTAGFINEVHHPDWLANPVLVNKKNGKMRMCVDYTNLNKAFRKFLFHCHVSIKSLILPRDVKPFLSLLHIPVTIK